LPPDSRLAFLLFDFCFLILVMGFTRVADTQDKQIGSGIAGGDTDCWQPLLSDLIPKLYAMFMQRWPNPSLTEELVQKTVFDAVRGRHGFDPAKGSPQDWIFGIAYNNVRLELRKRASAPLLDSDTTKYLEMMDTRPLPDEVLERKEMRQRVRATLDDLPHRERDVLQARYLEGLPIADIATRMNVTPKAIYSLLYRAGVSFKQRLLGKTPDALQGNNYAK
jgi:RNA polymerase sigma-70 factor, ECF subfamily